MVNLTVSFMLECQYHRFHTLPIGFQSFVRYKSKNIISKSALRECYCFA